jgi:hypothetical protein
MGILRRDRIDGILLDFDLYQSAHGNHEFTGESVAACLCETQLRTCAVFVHSQNPNGGRHVNEMLSRAGFSVEQDPWSDEGHDRLQAWLRELVEDD